MIKRLVALLIIVLSFSTINAQYFEVIGERIYTPNNWDFPTVNNTYFDANGDYYVYINEAMQPRNHELIRYDFDTEEFEDLTDHSFEIEGGVSTSSSVGFPDGSMYTISNTFEEELYAHHFMPDGTYEFLGENPLGGTGNVSSSLDNAGNYYIAAVGGGSFIKKYDGTDWTALKELNNNTAQNVFFAQLHFDENDVLYASFIQENPPNRDFYFQVYDPSDDLWSTLAFVEDVNFNCRVSFVSPTEAYILLKSSNTFEISIYLYDGNGLELLGAPFPENIQEGADVYMSKQGTLYAAEADDMYSFDFTANRWNKLDADFIDGNTGKTSGFMPYLSEDANGRIFNTFNERNTLGESGLTTVIYTPQYVSVNDSEFANEVSVYPNPASDFITIESETAIESVKIFSVDGKLVKETNKRKIDVSEFPNGLYSVEISSKEKTATKKVLIGQ